MTKLFKGILICFEGIDGSGKSETAASVHKELQSIGVPATRLDRNCTEGCPDFVVDRLSALKELLWNYPQSTSVRAYGDRHLIHLLISWFHCFDEWVIRPRIMIPQVVLLDTWIYKYVARFALKPAFNESALLSSFDGLTTPSRIILLSLDPHRAWLRKSKMAKDTEAESTTENTDLACRFVEYQTKVQRELTRFSTKLNWQTIDAGLPLPAVTSAMVREIVKLIPHIQRTAFDRPITRAGRRLAPIRG